MRQAVKRNATGEEKGCGTAKKGCVTTKRKVEPHSHTEAAFSYTVKKVQFKKYFFSITSQIFSLTNLVLLKGYGDFIVLFFDHLKTTTWNRFSSVCKEGRDRSFLL